MGLSRLENFLKNVRGNILYVSPNDLDSTDSVENKGNSLTRPFKTIQRALVEASRFSYQQGLNNDRFGQTTILLYPGDHIIDNRPGWIPDGSGNFRNRFGSTSSDFSAWDLNTNFELANVNNALYKLNSIHGGVIIPRGTSLVGMDLRKTKIRPKYVPNPVNDNVERSAIFRVTGACYFWQFSIFDADPNGTAYLDYTENAYKPDFSHHKLTAFEYADGVNKVRINDTHQTYGSNTRTDLDMYYEKVGLCYGVTSGRQIEPDYPSTGIDIQPKIDEYRIVGPTAGSVGISSIKAGDGTTSSTIITVTTNSALTGADVDTAVVIDGITATGYDGQFVITEKVNTTQFKYEVQNAPSNALPSTSGSTAALTIDTVTSASPYIFNCSLRSVYGMCGLLADGSKSTGFKSMVVAQFTGIGLQKDNNAFLKYNATTGAYDDGSVSGNESLNTDSRSVFKPTYNNFHIKAINDSTIQAASAFAIGYAEHFAADTGGDMSVTNSNSNFGAKALVSAGFKKNAYSQDDVGYITHIIPPKEFPLTEKTVEFTSVDIATTVGVGTTNERLYLKGQTNPDVKPENVIDGYRIGARTSDSLKVLIPVSSGVSSEFSSRIVMQGYQTTDSIKNTPISGEKVYNVNRSAAGINSVTSNTFKLTSPHTFSNGESVRVISSDGRLPDGVESNQVYYAITSGISTNVDLKLAKTLSDAENASALTINNLGGPLKIVSRVSDKNSGDIGHPIQYDNTVKNQWYINVATASTDNQIQPDVIISMGTTALGNATPRTYIKRKSDERSAVDTTYRFRYVLPSSSGVSVGRPPTSGYILQESNTSIGSTTSEVATYFGTGSLTNVDQQRNFSFIANANWSSSPHPDAANILTEMPHNLSVGSLVEVVNVKSGVNTTGVGNSGFNGTFEVTGISSAREFTVGVNTDPGTFTVIDTLTRSTNLPHFKRKNYNTSFYIQDSDEVQEYVSGKQDGIYYLTVLNASNSPSVSPFTGEKFNQSIKHLYPQVNRDNPVADPESTTSYAVSNPIGEVTVNDVRDSITKETVDSFLRDTSVGLGITNIITDVGVSTNAGVGTIKIPVGTLNFPISKSHTVFTDVDHGFNGIQKVSIASSGAGYGTGGGSDETYYNAQLLNSAQLGVPIAAGYAVGVGSTTGQHATARVTVDKHNGGITNITIMNAGSAFGIGNTMYVAGIGTTTAVAHIPAKITVSKINSNIGDVVRISGVTSESYNQYNDLYRISEVHVGAARSFAVISNTPITGVSTAGIGSVVTSKSIVYKTGNALGINTFTYDSTLGIATVGVNTYHGLKINSKVRVAISTVGVKTDGHNAPATSEENILGSYIVTKDLAVDRFTINVGASVTTGGTISVGASIFVMREGIAANDGTPTIDDESLNGRMIPIYNDLNAPLEAAMTKTATTIQLVGMGLTNQYNVNIGDYLTVDDEIVRIRSTVRPHSSDSDPSGPITVFRAVLGTKAATHSVNSVVRKITPLPVELRRHSINRVAGHTFEYVGFGPGNYSTALPEKQDRTISETEELLGQSTRKNGGINYFTGMNDRGTFFSGNKKLNSVTGKEEVFNTPIRSVTGEDISVKKGINLVKATEGDFSQSIKIDGGDQGKAISEFKGPVIFSNKVTSSSTKGLEATSLFLQGESTVSRKYTVGIATPIDSGTPGDITFKENPEGGKYLGWVYTTDKAWKRFGSISDSGTADNHVFNSVGIATTSISGSGTLDIFHNNSSLQILNIRSNGQADGYAGISFGVNKPTGRPKAAIFFQETHGQAHFTGDLAFALNTTTGSAGAVTVADEKLRISGVGSVGVGTAAPRAAVDLWDAGPVTKRFAILPKVTTTQRGNLVGVHTGSIIYNTTTAKFQGYNGSWVDLH